MIVWVPSLAFGPERGDRRRGGRLGWSVGPRGGGGVDPLKGFVRHRHFEV